MRAQVQTDWRSNLFPPHPHPAKQGQIQPRESLDRRLS